MASTPKSSSTQLSKVEWIPPHLRTPAQHNFIMASLSQSTSTQLSSIANIPPHLRTPAQQNLRYLQQRIHELEQELENKRVQLFESEETRTALQARLAGNETIFTPESSVASSVKQIEYNVENEEDLGEREEEEGSSGEGNRTCHWIISQPLYYRLLDLRLTHRLNQHFPIPSLQNRIQTY